MGAIIDRRKLKLSTTGSVSKYYRRLKVVLNEGWYTPLNGGNAREWNLEQPGFFFNPKSGVKNYVTSGNDQWIRGDIIEYDLWEQILQMLNGGGGGGDINWEPSREEFEILFDGLELPNLTKQSVESITTEIVRCGYSRAGGIMDLKKTFRNSMGRRFALEGAINSEIEATQDEEKRAKLLKDKEKIPFLDDQDARYRRYEEIKTPSKKMVMFLIMDVSGSMEEYERNLAKLFSNLVVTFLSRKYDVCVVEYIVFTGSAYRVGRKDFFHGNLSGGTTLSAGLNLALNIMESDYSKDWNIYSMIFCDNGFYDITQSVALLSQIINKGQYTVYTSIGSNDMDSFYQLADAFVGNDGFNTSIVEEPEDVIPEFISLFSK